MVTTEAAPVAHYILPAPRLRFIRIGGPLWLLGWGAGLYGAVIAFGNGHRGYALLDVFLFSWLTLWIIGGVLIFGLVLWAFLGREHLAITPDTLSLQRWVGLPGPIHKFPLGEIEKVHFREMPTNLLLANSRWSPLGIGPGKIRFTHRGRDYSCGLGLTDERAREIVDALNRRTRS
jgi:hypothetical protein